MILPTTTTRAPFWVLAGAIAVPVALGSTASGGDKQVPAWKNAAPGVKAFLGDDGGGVNTVTVCDTADRFRDWLDLEHPAGCQTFQHDLPAIIEVVIFDPVQDTVKMPDPVGLPLVKVHIPSRNFIGYLHLLALHPVVPSGIVVNFRKSANETIKLYQDVKIGSSDNTGLDLGDQVSARVVKYDPSKDDEWDLQVTILDGKYAGRTGWMRLLGAEGEDVF